MNIVRFVGKEACSAALYNAAINNNSFGVIDNLTGDRNVSVQFTLNGSPLLLEPDERTQDFMDLAVAIYIADELIKREDTLDRWTRDFDFLVPVCEPEIWCHATPHLASTLNFLSQDRFKFNWVKRTALPSGRRHRQGLPHGFDTVCLFSGGIDSLLGAHHLLAEGRQVLLVGHQAEGTTAKAQKDLFEMLADEFGDQAALIQCHVARSGNRTHRYALPNKVEESHRPRSFLFLALAVAIAKAAGIQSVFIPENGMIALNPPLQRSRVGTHSTRTAHPIYLTRLLDFLHAAEVFDGEIRNPFLYLSKTDMLRNLDPNLFNLVQRSVSCSHALRYQDEGVRHCGYCVPCLHRRAAMMICGLDVSDDYAFDIFSGAPSRICGKEFSRHLQLDAKALLPFARSMATASDLELQKCVLSHGYFPPSVGEKIGLRAEDTYQSWAEMIRRWANDLVAEFELRISSEMKLQLGF
jgi:7-cyano-7-deazaguanine synthase in queuosine biosynthesis